MEAYNPRNLAELRSALALLTMQSKILAGGTDLIIQLPKMNPVDRLLYICRVDELKSIQVSNNQVEIGAGVTMRELAQSTVIQETMPALAMAGAEMGSIQIRNHATVGGNIAGASPASDLMPVLFLLNASTLTLNPSGELISKNIAELVTGAGRTSLKYNEILFKIIIPIPDDKWFSAFFKLGFRKKVTIARINAALGWSVDSDGTITKASLFLGAIAPRPVNCECAQMLVGTKADESVITKIADELSARILANTPKEFDRDYKVKSVYGLLDDIGIYIRNNPK